MERIRALQQRLPREQKGQLNLIYMNALAELHNYSRQLGCDCAAMTSAQRTEQVRRVGRTAIRQRQLQPGAGGMEAAAEVVGAAVLPHMVALELIDWLEELGETIRQKKLPIRLKMDREAAQFAALAEQIGGFYENVELNLEQR